MQSGAVQGLRPHLPPCPPAPQYWRPADWEIQGEQRKQQRRAEHERRQEAERQKREAAAAARKARQAGAAKPRVRGPVVGGARGA